MKITHTRNNGSEKLSKIFVDFYVSFRHVEDAIYLNMKSGEKLTKKSIYVTIKKHFREFGDTVEGVYIPDELYEDVVKLSRKKFPQFYE